jgi:hypothetical protein
LEDFELIGDFDPLRDDQRFQKLVASPAPKKTVMLNHAFLRKGATLDVR